MPNQPERIPGVPFQVTPSMVNAGDQVRLAPERDFVIVHAIYGRLNGAYEIIWSKSGRDALPYIHMMRQAEFVDLLYTRAELAAQRQEEYRRDRLDSMRDDDV